MSVVKANLTETKKNCAYHNHFEIKPFRKSLAFSTSFPKSNTGTYLDLTKIQYLWRYSSEIRTLYYSKNYNFALLQYTIVKLFLFLTGLKICIRYTRRQNRHFLTFYLALAEITFYFNYGKQIKKKMSGWLTERLSQECQGKCCDDDR